MKPEITDTISGYLFNWTQDKLKVKVSRVHVHKDGRVTGEIELETSLNGFGPILMPAFQLNFSADRTRKSLVNDLTEKFPTWKWQEVVDQLCYYVQERARKGEPVIEIGGGGATPPVYLIDPLVIENLPNVIFGEPGSVKTTTALFLAILLSLNWYDNPFKKTLKVNASKDLRILWLDWESDQTTIGWQLQCLSKGLNNFCTIDYRRCHAPLADELEEIQEYIDSHNSDVIIIDSVALACSGDLMGSEAPNSYYAAVRRFNRTSIHLAHTSKNSETSKKSIYGSVFFEALSRNIWESVKIAEPGEKTVKVTLYHKKSPPFGCLHVPIGIEYKYGEDRIEVSLHDPRQEPSFIKKMSITTQVIESIKSQGCLTSEELREKIESNRSAIDQAVHRLKEKGIIQKLDGEKWGLTL